MQNNQPKMLDQSSRRRLPAWLLSVMLHTGLMLLLGLSLRRTPPGVAIEPNRTGGIVLARHEDGKREYFDAEDSATAEQATQATANTVADSLPSDPLSELDLTGILPAADPLIGSGGSGDSLPSAENLTRGSRPNRTFDGKARTRVFGVVGEGTKFVYVFDRSGSMDGFGGRPLAAAKAELIASLADLDRTHQFQIIFYNERPRIFRPSGGTPRLVWGDERGKTLAEQFVRGIVADGGTRHLEALRMALNMRPDVIFFLTDADEPQLTSGQLAKIRRAGGGTSIHTIEFGFGPFRGEENFLVRLARQNNGRHAYVDVSQLRRAK